MFLSRFRCSPDGVCYSDCLYWPARRRRWTATNQREGLLTLGDRRVAFSERPVFDFVALPLT